MCPLHGFAAVTVNLVEADGPFMYLLPNHNGNTLTILAYVRETLFLTRTYVTLCHVHLPDSRYWAPDSDCDAH